MSGLDSESKRERRRVDCCVCEREREWESRPEGGDGKRKELGRSPSDDGLVVKMRLRED